MSRHLCHGAERRDTRERSRCPGISVMEPKDVILGNVPGARCPGISVMEPKDVILGNVPGARCPGISVMESDVQASLSWSRKT